MSDASPERDWFEKADHNLEKVTDFPPLEIRDGILP